MYLVCRRFAHQCFADSGESARRVWNLFSEALGQNSLQVASSLRLAFKFTWFASNPRCYPFSGRSIRKNKVFSKPERRFAENSRDSHANRKSIRANRPTKTVFHILPMDNRRDHLRGCFLYSSSHCCNLPLKANRFKSCGVNESC